MKKLQDILAPKALVIKEWNYHVWYIDTYYVQCNWIVGMFLTIINCKNIWKKLKDLIGFAEKCFSFPGTSTVSKMTFVTEHIRLSPQLSAIIVINIIIITSYLKSAKAPVNSITIFYISLSLFISLPPLSLSLYLSLSLWPMKRAHHLHGSERERERERWREIKRERGRKMEERVLHASARRKCGRALSVKSGPNFIKLFCP